jgi:N-acetylglucosaminyl-diphospho-decaprenol L-rhamnosyltransferase
VRLLSVIVNWRTADMTTRAVEALLRETEGLDAKAIVVDNDSGDGSYEKLCAAVEANGWSDRVEIVAAAKNGGYGYGNNVGFRIGLAAASPPDYFYVLNSDAFPDPGSIHSMLAFMDAHPKVGIAGNYVHGTDGRTRRPSASRARPASSSPTRAPRSSPSSSRTAWSRSASRSRPPAWTGCRGRA